MFGISIDLSLILISNINQYNIDRLTIPTSKVTKNNQTLYLT